ncbi:MAG: metallophosphoesterase [Oscillospiraceae bacterium]|nr:metallophosphoesterase [Oscillospiraceae bacterium]
MRARVATEYILASPKVDRSYRIAVVADLHNRPYEDILPLCAAADLVLIPGDLAHRYPHQAARGLAFLRAAADLAPTYYTYGNHEDLCDHVYMRRAADTGAVLLNNTWRAHAGLAIGGLYLYDTPRLLHWHDKRDIGDRQAAAAAHLLNDLERAAGFRLLLCHKPNHFFTWVQPHAIDLTISGHAHGGQIRLWGRGLYAPHQGLLPAWTHGLYADGRLLVSSGAANTAGLLPRLGNPCEVAVVRLERS